MKFKVGDKVKIIAFNKHHGIYPENGFPYNINDTFEIKQCTELVHYPKTIAYYSVKHGTNWYITEDCIGKIGPLTEIDILDNIQRNIADDL